MKQRIKQMGEHPGRTGRREAGFTLVELLIVIAIVLITTAISVPWYVRMMHTSKLRGVASDFSGLVQVVRIRAVQDGKYYSLLTSNAQALGFVDFNGNKALDPGEVSVPINPEVTVIDAANAPATAQLKGQFLPAGGAGLIVYDAGPSGNTPITFGSRGIPCKTQTATGGFVCESGGGAIPFWIFFKNTVSGEQEAVTVNPAGRIRKWYYGKGVLEHNLMRGCHMRIGLQGKMRRDGERGSTLIELMIAMLVLAIGFAGVTTLMVTALASNNRASRDTTATLLAQKVEEEISAQNINVDTNVTVTDCANNLFTFSTTPGPVGVGTGANLNADKTIDFTQNFTTIPAGYAMQYVDCSAQGGLQTTYDVRWNVMSVSTNPSLRMIIAGARPVASNVKTLGGLAYAKPTTLWGIGGPNTGE